MIVSEQALYQRALDFASEKHGGQFRIGGLPYITHPVSVAQIVREKGFGLSFQITALFHDLLEDTDATEQEIEEIGGADVLTAVKLLTKQKGYRMEEYVAGVRKNEMAFAVKGADRLHNLQCAFEADEDFRRRYILETIDWYMDFAPEIPAAVKKLAESMEKRLTEYEFLYEPIENWKL